MKNEEGLNPGSIMQDLFGSVRRSLHFRPKLDSDESPNVISSVADRIGSCIRKSRVGLGGFLPKSPSTSSRRMTMGFLPKSPSKMGIQEEELPRIRWRKGELIGSGAFGQVFMGMNLDSGELLAVKQVMIESSNASKEKAQAHIRELEEEVKLLKNLSHPNIVRYLGTVREENTLNILLEFVPGGSISSLLSKFGSFPETVIRMYTKQILQGLEYLHRNKIIHRDIKGANILVDNKGCIKLADFGASKQVAQLATMAAAKSFKGTAYWMAPEVIVQSGYSFSADIWSVGCTVIEMVTGKPPWSGQYQEVAALFHVGTTKSHPPIPDHLSSEAKDFLLKCLQEDAGLRPSACDLLQHPFVTGELNSEIKESSIDVLATNKTHMSNNNFGTIMHSERRPIWETGTDDEMCRLDDEDDFPVVVSESLAFDDWPSKLGDNINNNNNNNNNNNSVINSSVNDSISGFKFPSEMTCEDDEEVTENTIRAFLDEKAIDLKKLQTPLYEEFYNSLNSSTAPFIIINNNNDSKLPPVTPNRNPSPKPSLFRSGSSRISTTTNNDNDSKLPPVSPNRIVNNGPGLFRLGSSRIVGNSPNMANSSRRVSHGIIGGGGRVLQEIAAPPQLNDLVMDNNDLPDPASPCLTFSKKKETWREELEQELDMERAQREKMGPSRMTSPKDSPLSHKRNRPTNNTNKLENI